MKTRRRWLVVDCYLDEAGGARNAVPHLEGATVLRPAHERLPDRLEADALVITGSAASVLDPPDWLPGLERCVAEAAARGTAILGLCFGHQVLARAVFGLGAVRRSPTPELGWCRIDRSGEDPLFEGVDECFRCFVSHGDEIDPDCEAFVDGARVLARSRDCAVQAFRVGARRQWGVQFHAEMGLDESRELVESRSTEPGRAEALLRNAVATPALASRLFANFRRSVEAGVSGTGER